jgi:hypothetical protein
MLPQFPQFKSLEIHDREFIHDALWSYQPHTSELTFTNLFVWRTHYGFHWSMHKDCLILLSQAHEDDVYLLPPIGHASRLDVTIEVLEWLKKKYGQARIERADKRLLTELDPEKESVRVEPQRDHFDYVYKSKHLIELAGNIYHSKRNHINKFLKSYSFSYEKMSEKHLHPCMELIEQWCGVHRCEEDLNLLGEWEAIGDLLAHFEELKVQAGVVLIDNKVEAFTFGESLNTNTAVVHFEKANPAINGLYSVINQKFAEENWSNTEYINRQQDLGQPGLRKAKLSYHPETLVEKYTIRLQKK